MAKRTTHSIRRIRRQWIVGLAALLLIGSSALAQRNPHIGYVYPAGGKRGTTLDVAVGGQALGAVSAAFVSGTGVSAEIVSYTKPLNQKQFIELRENIGKLQKRKAAAMKFRRQQRGRRQRPPKDATWTPEDEETLQGMRAVVAQRNKRRANPALGDTAVLRITIAPNARIGLRELRLLTRANLTNPLVFCVSELREFKELETPRSTRPQRGRRGRGRVAQRRPPVETHVTLPAVANGQIMPGDTDRFRFQATKGQRLVVAASARELIPYLADAVPGWFQATLALYDAQGHEIAYVDDYRFDPDPVLFFEVPTDGDYIVEIRDAIYRGREDFVYRITLGQLPFVTSVFPLGGPADAEIPIYLHGWNLPTRKLTVAPNAAPGTTSIAVRAQGIASNAVPFARDTLPECLEREPNDSPKDAQRVPPAFIINGRINRPGDLDVFRFDAQAGQTIVAAVQGRRLRSPIDSVLRLTDAKGKQLAFNDDREDKAAGLTTHHADSSLRVTLPATGTYYVHLGDAQRRGGSDYGYRLRISAPRPDFDLRVVPSSINGRAGQTVPITVHAMRKDGFTGGIALTLRDAPTGFALNGAWLPGKQNRVRLTLTVPWRSSPKPISLRLQGHARVGNRKVVRPVVAAEDMMQAFLYRHLVPSQELLVKVTGRGRTGPPLQILGEGPVLIPSGCMAVLRVRQNAPRRRGATTAFKLELSNPPAGVVIHNVSKSRSGLEVTLFADAALVKPGTRGNLIFQAFSVAPSKPGKAPARRQARRRLLGTLPAVPFEIVAQ